jgi:hypothetical protein
MCHFVRNLVSAALKLKSENISAAGRNYFSEQIFEAVYRIGASGVQLSGEERTLIGPLIKQVVKHLDLCVFELVVKFDPDRGNYNHILRSGIQFLLDNFKELPVNESEVLGESLKRIEESGNIESLDEELISFKDNPPVNYETVPHPATDFLRPTGIPESHFWWS